LIHLKSILYKEKIKIHHNQLQGLGLLTCSEIRVRQIDSSASLVALISLVFLHDDSQTAYKEKHPLAFLKYVLNNSVGILLLFLLG
jgi:hypothetical protein